jgi:hypothetical protein
VSDDICKQCGTMIDAGDPSGLCARCGTAREGAAPEPANVPSTEELPTPDDARPLKE